jgi:large subunit ribosomal protein L31
MEAGDCDPMTSTIHPIYQQARVQCACGATFMTRSTRAELRTEVCSACHPFYTGEQRLSDRGGRIERFNRRWGANRA